MATLEVHDGQGRVQFIELDSKQMILFGTSPSCDIILDGPDIKPVHGRIRWKSGGMKVESSPDAEFVLINGRRMVTGSVRQGDEISVGPCRIFLLRMDEGPEPASMPGAKAVDGRTRVMPPPLVSRTSTTGARPDEQTESKPRHGQRSSHSKRENGPPELVEAIQSLGDSVTREIFPAQTPKKDPARSKPTGWLRRLLRRWMPEDEAAPGRERIISSPLVIGLVAALVVLVGMGFWLKSIIAVSLANRAFTRGIEEFEDGDYRTSIRDLDRFMASNPEDKRVGKARVIRALANVRQYVSPNASTWTSALDAAREMFEQVGEEEEFRDQRVELAELVLRIGEGLADRAMHGADAQSLSEAESSVSLHAQVAGEPAAAFLGRSRLPAKLADARAAVRKSQFKSKSLAAMDLAIQEGSASRVYDTRDDLVERYPDLAQDKDLRARMTSANDLIRKAVTIDPTHRSASSTPRPDPLGPATSVVLRTRREVPSAPPPAESIVFALADGFAYALDATAGAPLWQVPLGLASPYVPQPVAGEASVIAFDARSNELVRLDSRTGAWPGDWTSASA